MLRGSPMSPSYSKERAASVVNQLGVGDLNYNSLNGSGWRYWTQTDWSGGFQALKFKDDASFKDGQAIDTIKKYGQISLQYGWTSAARISGSYSYGAHAVHDLDLLFGATKNAAAKIFKVTSASVISTLSAMSTISAVNSMTRFKNDTVIGLTKQTAASATVKSMIKYNGAAISGFRAANPVVRAVHAIGIRLYSGERVGSLSGDVLYYSTDLSTFTSAYQAGKNRKITNVNDVNGSPYFFVQEGKRVEMFRWDEFAERAYPIYTWENLTNFGVKKYLSFLMITGTSNVRSVAYAFNGARIWQVLEDQLQDSSYDFSKPFEFEGNLQVKGATYDGEFWFPGIYGKLSSAVVTPFENFNNKPYGYGAVGTVMYLGYRDTTKYNISGHVISSEFGADIGGVDKLINAVDINTESLATGQTVEVLRSVDGGASFTTIGKASFAQDGAANKKTLFFPSGYVTKLWNWKAQLVGPGTTTPTLKDVTFQYRPVPDMKKRWAMTIDAGDSVLLMNKQHEQRDGKALMMDLWLEMEAKRTVLYEDVDAFEVALVSAMTSGATSARVRDTRLMPPRGRMRIKKSNQIEEMIYTSADGGRIAGISRAQKGTLARAYTSADVVDNYYNVVITDVRELLNDTNQNTTESIAQVTLLEV
jgi:hypothetical protein